MNEFESARDAERKTGVPFKAISGCASGRRATAYKFCWSFDKNFTVNNNRITKAKHCLSNIIQLDDSNNIISEFSSAREAEQKTGISFKNISNSVRRGYKAGGFIWKYKE